MAQDKPADSEASYRALVTGEVSPATPAGFLRLFDAVVFGRVANEALSRASDAGSGLSVLRHAGQREMTSYFDAMMRCARDLEGQMVSPETVAVAVSARVRKLDLRKWFRVVLTDRAPDSCSTHFIRYTNDGRGGLEEAVELLPDIHLSRKIVRQECERMKTVREELQSAASGSGGLAKVEN